MVNLNWLVEAEDFVGINRPIDSPISGRRGSRWRGVVACVSPGCNGRIHLSKTERGIEKSTLISLRRVKEVGGRTVVEMACLSGSRNHAIGRGGVKPSASGSAIAGKGAGSGSTMGCAGGKTGGTTAKGEIQFSRELILGGKECGRVGYAAFKGGIIGHGSVRVHREIGLDPKPSPALWTISAC